MQASPADGIGTCRGLFRLLRPKQWVKNVFVLPAPIFAQVLTTTEQIVNVSCAFLAFCLLSSAVYAINDVVDAEADLRHEKKRHRPVASGVLSTGAATAVAVVLVLLAGVLVWKQGERLTFIAVLYLGNAMVYSFFLKRFVIADVLSIALGFMLRIHAGVAVADVEPSSWLLVCGFSLALFLGFCKRRSEIARFADAKEAKAARRVFSAYTEDKLNLLISSSATISIITYMLFTVSPETIAEHGTGSLIYSSPFVVYGVFRFLLKTLELQGEDATETILTDVGFLLAGVGWALSVLWAVYTWGDVTRT